MSKSNKMGVVQLTILTMVNMMGSGIIMLPTKLAEVGTISIISAETAVGSMALAWAFAKCGMFSRKSGGMGATPSMPLASRATLWPTIPTGVTADRQRGDCHLRRGLRYGAVWRDA